MKNITKKLFLYAFLLALIASGVIYIYLKSFEKEHIDIIETTSILVAANDIPARTIITKDMITQVEIPKEADIGFFINDTEELIGKYTKEPIYKDERFKMDKLIDSIEEELSLVLKADQRAVSIMVNLDSGVADLIKPGDFVDVLVYLPEIKEANIIVRPDVAKIILQNTEVVAINQNLYRDSEPQEEIPTTYYVTLSVSVKEVEELVLAQNIGSIKLALRPLNEKNIHNTDGAIWEELLPNHSNQINNIQPQYEIQTGSK